MNALSDAPSYAALRDADILSTLHAAAFDRPWSRAGFADLLEKPMVHAFAAHCGAQPVGFILLQQLPPDGSPDTHDLARRGEILTLAVVPRARRKGIAQKLIGHSVTQTGLDELWLEVAADNEAALGLYAACGFRPTGRRPAYYKNADGTRSDAVHMQAVFSQPMC